MPLRRVFGLEQRVAEQTRILGLGVDLALVTTQVTRFVRHEIALRAFEILDAPRREVDEPKDRYIEREQQQLGQQRERLQFEEESV